MNATETLTITGGLPPSAFLLSPQAERSLDFASCHGVELDSNKDFDTIFLEPSPLAFPSLQNNGFHSAFTSFEEDRLGAGADNDHIASQDTMSAPTFHDHNLAECRCVDFCQCAGLVDSWFKDLPTMDNSPHFEQPNQLLGSQKEPSPFTDSLTALTDLSSALPHHPVSGPLKSHGHYESRGVHSSSQDDVLTTNRSLFQGNSMIPYVQKPLDGLVTTKAVPAEKIAGKRRLVMPKSAKAALEDSFRLEPYPDKLEVSSIAKSAKMSVKQVKTWFSNKRSRTQPQVPQICTAMPANKKEKNSGQNLTRASLESLRPAEEQAQVSETLQKYLELPPKCPSLDGLTTEEARETNGDMRDSLPPAIRTFCQQYPAYTISPVSDLDSSKSLPPRPFEGLENSKQGVGANTEAVVNQQSHWYPCGYLSKLMELQGSVQNGGKPEDERFHSSVQHCDQTDDLILHSSPGSAAGSYRSGASSFGSGGSRASFSSLQSRASRRGRRRWDQNWKVPDSFKQINLRLEQNIKTKVAEKLTRKKHFQCAFCAKFFTTRYAWNRHEESVHVPRHTWICGMDQVPSPRIGLVCQCCGKVDPDSEHRKSHNFSSCAQKSEFERTFSRRDGLVQHLRIVHNCLFPSADLDLMIDSWAKKEPPLDPDSPFLLCSFCEHVSPTWEARVDHIADHVNKVPSY